MIKIKEMEVGEANNIIKLRVITDLIETIFKKWEIESNELSLLLKGIFIIGNHQAGDDCEACGKTLKEALALAMKLDEEYELEAKKHADFHQPNTKGAIH